MERVQMTDQATLTVRDQMFSGVARIFGDGGIAIQDGLDASASQRDYSQRMAEAICRSVRNHDTDPASGASIMLASADTGTGKTIGYGVPLLLRAAMGFKVGIATHSHALQRQLLGTPETPGDLVRIVGWIEGMGLGRLKIARRLGRQAFISCSAVESLLARLTQEREDLQLTVKDLVEIEPILDFARESNDGKNSGLIEDLREKLGGFLPLGISAVDISLGVDSDPEDFRAYDEHLEVAESADVIIFSHAYLAACAMYRGGVLMNSPIDSLVIDEADRLVDVAASAFRFETSLRRCAAGLKNHGTAGEAARQATAALADYAQSLCEGGSRALALEEIPVKARIKIVQMATLAKEAITGLLGASRRASRMSVESRNDLLQHEAVLERFVRSASTQMSDAPEANGNFYVAALSFSPVKSLPSIAVMPRNPGRILAKLWNAGKGSEEGRSPVKSVLLTSATLGVPGRYSNVLDRFRTIANDLGINILKPRSDQHAELDLWANYEPDKFGAVKFILADPSLPSPVNGSNDESQAILEPQWFTYAANMIAKAKAAGGRTLVLCNSYRDAELFAERLLGLGITALQQMRGQSVKDCELKFLADKNSVWLSPTAWEGLNLPGAIMNLVIPRIPFSAPDPTEQALLRSYGKLTDESITNILHAKMMNATKRKTRQGLGRPIRSKTDKARIWIADPRFPLHSLSGIPLRHPKSIQYSAARRYKGLHAVIPHRFDAALEHAEILLENGSLIG
jgi:ATP-dependent DNA helicase DinG